MPFWRSLISCQIAKTTISVSSVEDTIVFRGSGRRSLATLPPSCPRSTEIAPDADFGGLSLNKAAVLVGRRGVMPSNTRWA